MMEDTRIPQEILLAAIDRNPGSDVLVGILKQWVQRGVLYESQVVRLDSIRRNSQHQTIFASRVPQMQAMVYNPRSLGKQQIDGWKDHNVEGPAQRDADRQTDLEVLEEAEAKAPGNAWVAKMRDFYDKTHRLSWAQRDSLKNLKTKPEKGPSQALVDQEMGAYYNHFGPEYFRT